MLLNLQAVRLAQGAPSHSNLRVVLAEAGKIDVAVRSDLVLRDFDTKDQFEELENRLLREGERG